MYQLIEGVYLVKGALNSAILDTNTGLIYTTSNQGYEILTHKISDIPYWESLVKAGLAEKSSEENIPQLPIQDDLKSLRFVWFEIVTDDCNERCAHCYADSMPKTYRREMLKQHNTHESLIPLPTISAQTLDENARPRMTYDDWLQAIKDAFNLGCKRGQFIGGEPFLYKGSDGETVLDLAEYAINLGYEMVEIYTNGTLLTDKKVQRIKELGLNIAVSLYSNDPAVHDSITRTPGSHKKTMSGLQMLKDAGVTTRVEIILMRTNQHTVESTLNLRETMGFNGKNPDPLRPKGRGDNPMLQPDFSQLVKYGLILKPNFYASKRTIAHYNSGHSCLLGKATITEFGDVLPCIFSRNLVVGNLLVACGLPNVIHAQATQKIWQTTKDDVLVCQDCEYRYVCFDCRPLSEGVSEGRATYQNAPYPRCTYNPYSGIWGEGLWRVNEDGHPVYDESFGPLIKEHMKDMPHEQMNGPIEH